MEPEHGPDWKTMFLYQTGFQVRGPLPECNHKLNHLTTSSLFPVHSRCHRSDSSPSPGLGAPRCKERAPTHAWARRGAPEHRSQRTCACARMHGCVPAHGVSQQVFSTDPVAKIACRDHVQRPKGVGMFERNVTLTHIECCHQKMTVSRSSTVEKI